MTSHILAFLCGSLTASIAWFLYLLHAEQQNNALIAAVRRHERQRAYAEGYQDHARLSTSSPGQPLSPIAR